MGVKSRGAAWQVDFTFQGKRYRTQFDSETEAQAWELNARASLLQGQEPIHPHQKTGNKKGRRETLKELGDYCLDNLWNNAESLSTIKSNLKSIYGVIGESHKLNDVDLESIDNLRKQLLQDGNSAATVNRKTMTLTTMLGLAKQHKWITEVPKIKPYAEAEGRLRVYTAEEEKEMLDYAGDLEVHWLKDLLTIGYDTGLRRGELLALSKVNVTGESLTIYGKYKGTRTKSGKSRTIPMTERVKEITTRIAHNNLWFSKSGNPVSETVLRREWSKMRSVLGYDDDPHYVLHTLRHTFISRLISKGVPVPVVQLLAGHSVIDTTMRYTHSSDKDLFNAIKVL